MNKYNQVFSDLLSVAVYNPNNQTGITNLLNFVFDTAVKLQASDVHFDPMLDFLRVRYRIDGRLVEIHDPIPKRIQTDFISRVKVTARIETSEVQSPLDGRIRHQFKSKTVDIRVASIPAHFGDVIVCRILDTSVQLKNIDELGMTDEVKKIFRQMIHSKNGLFIVVGSMGTGKSTTLHAALRELNSSETHIATLEDPVEQVIEGIDQIEVTNTMDFATGLRALLRMDCNCLMIGEMRDSETAKIAVRAALTGHLVLTTLHAKDSISAITRLIEMEVEPYLLSATLIGTMSQRLVRKLCTECHGVGCEKCHNSGFSGRMAIYEILPIDQKIRDVLKNFQDESQIRSAVQNFTTLYNYGLNLVEKKLTTLDEIKNVLGM